MTREEAIKVLNMVDAHGLADEAKHMAIKALEREPKRGHWIRHDNGKYHWYLCSCCDAVADSDAKMMAYKYCHFCGARMEGKE